MDGASAQGRGDGPGVLQGSFSLGPECSLHLFRRVPWRVSCGAVLCRVVSCGIVSSHAARRTRENTARLEWEMWKNNCWDEPNIFDQK